MRQMNPTISDGANEKVKPKCEHRTLFWVNGVWTCPCGATATITYTEADE